MNVSILEKYDNLILRNIKSDKLKYVLLMLPYKLPIVIILAILLTTKILSFKFFLVIIGGIAILKFITKGEKYENKK
ncbi:hypothetical protein [uncultured Clostridium sp.]|uniref:hypothetical protein n=1 Tax=uncultured Clostridium sp. TaxID=59620 RepID=UPI00261C5C3D|nr:hypothetical protein [uncultured Clostridium sp.]